MRVNWPPLAALALLALVWLTLPAAGQGGEACSSRECFGIDWANPGLREVSALDPLLRDDKGRTPLHYATRNCVSSAQMYALAENGADMESRERDTGYTPLQLAIIICRPHVVKTLLELGTDPNVANREGGGNALHLAITKGKPNNVLKLLIDNGVNPDTLSDKRLAPIIRLLVRGKVGLVDYLLDAGANPNVRDAGGITPAHYAAQKQDHVMLAKLHALGADLEAVTNEGRTPLHLAAAAGMNPQLFKVFFEARVAVNVYDYDARTPLHYAAGRTPAESVATILLLKANPHLLDGQGNSPLHYALRYNDDPRVVTALLRLGADPNLPNDDGVLPVILAAARASSAPLLTLLDYGVSVDVADETGRTLLHNAVTDGQVEVAVELLKHGADPYVLDLLGKSPLQLALDGELGEPARSIFVGLHEERQARIKEYEKERQKARGEKDKRREGRELALQVKQEERKAKRNQIRTTSQGDRQLRQIQKKQAKLEKQLQRRGEGKKAVAAKQEIEQLEGRALSVREQLQQIQQSGKERRLARDTEELATKLEERAAKNTRKLNRRIKAANKAIAANLAAAAEEN